MKMPAEQVPDKSPFPGVQAATFPLRPHMTFLWGTGRGTELSGVSPNMTTSPDDLI